MSMGFGSDSDSGENFDIRHNSNRSWFISSALSEFYSKSCPKIKSLDGELEISIVS